MSEYIKNWMSWEGGVDLAASTQEGLPMPNIIVHVARMAHTPVGSAPSGMVLSQPDLGGPPKVMGFVSSDPVVGAYFGPNIFAETPFETAPVLEASIEVEFANGVARARVEVGDVILETELSGLGETELMSRRPGGMTPFNQQGVEQSASSATLKVNGVEVSLILPKVGMSGGAPAVYGACGIYAR
jgi:hypothetical protein